MKKSIITIGREYGSGGHEIALHLSQALSVPLYDKEILTEAAKESGFSENIFAAFDEVRESSLLYALAVGTNLYGPELPLPVQLCLEQFRTIERVAEKGPCIFVGRCADYVLRSRTDVLSVFIHAPMKDRVARITELRSITPQEAEKLIRRNDKKRANYYEYYTDRIWGEASTYNLTVDSSLAGLEKSAELILTFMNMLG